MSNPLGVCVLKNPGDLSEKEMIQYMCENIEKVRVLKNNSYMSAQKRIKNESPNWYPGELYVKCVGPIFGDSDLKWEFYAVPDYTCDCGRDYEYE